MTRRILLHFLIGVSFISFSRCTQVWVEDDPVNSYSQNFEILWNTMDQRYTFFDYKKIDWDSVKTVYEPLAASSKSNKEFFGHMATMLNTLRDGHVNLRTQFDISRYLPYLSAPANYSFEVLERNYLGNYNITGFLLNQEIDGVGYIHYRSFVNPILDSELDWVIDRFEGLPGIIIDIRNNGGGNPENGLKMARRMISESTQIYSYQNKIGMGHQDLSPLKEVYLEPEPGKKKFSGRIVVLTNRHVFSAGSYFSAYIKGIPNAILMGDNTGGGSGVPAGFDLPNGWYLNYSSTVGYTVDGLNFEDGVPVDIMVSTLPTDIASGKDPILERAIQYIKTGN